MFSKKAIGAVLAASCVWAVTADTIVFKSGSRLEGTVVRIVGGEITFNSDDVGEVKVAADKVASLTTAKASTVQYKDKTTEDGVVNMKDGTKQIYASAFCYSQSTPSTDGVLLASLYLTLATFRPLHAE